LCQHAVYLEVEIIVNFFNFRVPVSDITCHDALLVLDVDVTAILLEQQFGALNLVIQGGKMQGSVALEVLNVETDTTSVGLFQVFPHFCRLKLKLLHTFKFHDFI